MTTNKQEWNQRHGFAKDASHSKAEIARKSPKATLKTIEKVYARGVGAYKTNPTSVRLKGSYKKDVKAPLSKKLSKEQWAMARVYSFVNKLEGRKTLNHDKDLV
jgi:hypothetical protein